MDRESFLARATSRKFIYCILVLASTVILTWFRRIDAITFSAVVIANGVTYAGANVAEKKNLAQTLKVETNGNPS